MNKQGGNAKPKQLMIHFQSTDPIMHMIVYELKQCYVLASENHSDMGNKDTRWPI